MANILFLQNTISELQGVMYLSKKLKEAKHKVYLLICSNQRKILHYIDEKNIQVVCFSLMYGHQFWASEISREIRLKKPHLKVLWGGIFPTFNVDYLLEANYVDAFCIGEGEDIILPLVETVLKNKKPEDLRGVAYLTDHELHENRICNYVDITNLVPDRDLYFQYSVLRTNPTKIFVCSRGCVGNCSYCYNSRMRDLYKDNPGAYLRYRNPEAIITEIRYVKERYGLKRIFFYDDILTADIHWMSKFLLRFKQVITVPYMCYSRADLINRETAGLLKESGCYMVSFGLESGNEDLRTHVLNKRIRDETIIEAAQTLKRFGLAFNTTNMMGFPHETYEMGLQTIELNIRIGAIGSCNILNPFPGTQLYEYCKSHHLFEEAYFQDARPQIHYYPLIKNPDREALGNLERLFQLAVFFPHTMYPIVKRIARLKQNFFFDLIFVVLQFFYVRFITERWSLRFMLWYYLEKLKSVFGHR